jgi:hypothetical protein
MIDALKAPAGRRFTRFALAVAAFAVIVWVQSYYDQALRRPEFFNGWLLLAGVTFLTLFNIRKKLPMLPLGAARHWTQLHIYIGFVTAGLFALHAGLSLPGGVLDSGLWLAFVLVVLSGVVGAYLSRTVPLRLREASEPILLERIPGYRAQLAREAAEIAEQSIVDQASLTISTFYAAKIHDFMQGPRNLFAHLGGSDRGVLPYTAGLDALERYVDDTGKEIIAELRDRVVAKNDLDFQYAHLMMLRLWLFVHIPATYGLLVFAAVHVAAVYAFSSGTP